MSLLLSDGRYKFKSRKWLRRFLDLESPYDTCLECGGSIKTDVAALLSQLLGSTVPSPSAADLLSDLSHVVICKREQCRKRAPRLYKTWCDKMWKHYLQEHGLSLNDCGSRPAGFTRKTWDKALEKTDEAADSAYESTKDGSSSDSDYETDSDSGDETEASSDEKDSTDSDKDTDTEVVGMGRLSITREPTRKTKPSFTKVTQVSAAEQRKQLLNTIVRTISQNYRRKGYIYGYRQPGLDGYIKIGYVFDTRKSQVDPVQYRLATWKTNCKHDIALVFTQKIECYATQRIESLIHKTLQKYRHEQHPPCESCQKRTGGGKHDEWFKVDRNKARKVVDFWARFAQTQPYRNGRLSQFWFEDIDFQARSKNIPKDYSVVNWMAAMTPLIDMVGQRQSADRWTV